MNAVARQHENELSRPRAWQQPRVRRRSARVDVAAGAGVALLTLLLAPGLAIVAVVALAMLLLCGLSALIARRRTRRSGAAGTPMAMGFRPSGHADANGR